MNAIQAVDELSKRPESRAHEMIRSIALGESYSMWLTTETRNAAIRSFAKNGNEQVTIELSRLLNLQEGYATIRQVAILLQVRLCPTKCIESIIEYQNHLWQGDLTEEERTAKSNPRMPDRILREIKDEEKENLNLLDSILRREAPITSAVLSQRYGFRDPSSRQFILDMISNLHLQTSCSDLRTAIATASHLSSSQSRVQPEIESVYQGLDCDRVAQ